MRQSERIKALEGRRVVVRQSVDGDRAGPRTQKRQRLPVGEKRASSATTKRSRNQVVFTSLPTDIFIQIISYLNPGDLLALARTNKSSRGFLMRRPSVHFWQQAERNLSEFNFPRCPPHMNEPQYAALLFTKTCTLCGTPTSSRADLYLYVRLCPSCRKTELIEIDEFPTRVADLIPCSPSTAASPQTDNTDIVYYCLRSEACKLDTQRSDLQKSGDVAALETWDYEQDQLIETRLRHGVELYYFLFTWDYDEKARQAMNERREAIEKRAVELELPWSDWCTEIHHSIFVFWHTLTEQVKPLTEGVWKTILPLVKLTLELNGQQGEQAYEQPLRRQCSKHLEELLLKTVAESDPGRFKPIATALGVKSVPSSCGVTNEMRRLVVAPAPSLSDSLKWDFMRDFRWAIHDQNAAEQLFASLLGNVNARAAQWIRQVEQGLTRLVSKERAKRIQDDVVLAVKGKTAATTHLSSITRRLLRADCVFKASKEHPLYSLLHGGSDHSVPTPLFYPELLVTLRGGVWNPAYFQSYSDGSRIAGALLTRLGTTDAANVELKVMGCRFVCGRCSDKRKRDWSGMIEHYVQAERRQNRRALKGSSDMRLNAHDLDEATDELAVQVVPEEEAGELPDISKIIPTPKPLCGERRYFNAMDADSPQKWHYLRTGELTFCDDDGCLVVM